MTAADHPAPDRIEPKEHSMNAEANCHSSAALRISPSAALRISLIPDPLSPPSNWRPAPDARAPAPRDSSELSVADAGHHMLTRVKHPDGGERTVAGTQADEEAQREKITRETDMGSHRHDRLPRWLRWIPMFVLLFDFGLLLYVFARLRRL